MRDADRQAAAGTAPTVTYTYDAAGQMLTRADSAGTSTFTYDAGHRLVGATTPTATVAYSYDAAGLRQSQTIGGVTTRFVVDPTFTDAQVVAEIVSGGSEAHYTYGLTRLSRHRGGVAAFLHADALGSLRLATDATGAPTERWDYDAFGAIATHVDPAGQPIPATAADAHSFLFAGEQYAPTLDLYYLRARHYAPTLGRFTQADAYRGRDTEPLTLHRYGYAHANPITNRDPSGYITIAEINATLRVSYIQISVATAPLVSVLNRLAVQASGVVNGTWIRVSEAMSARAAAYQAQIGRVGEAFRVNGVKFDGFANGILQEAKGPGYATFVRNGAYMNWYRGATALVEQAQRQLIAANGTPIQWHFAEKAAADATRVLFSINGISGIQIVFTPPL